MNNRYYRINISSLDDSTMNRVEDSMPHRLRRSLSGTGFCLLSGLRDHSYNCRGSSRRDEIVGYYERAFRKARRGVTIFTAAGQDRNSTPSRKP